MRLPYDNCIARERRSGSEDTAGDNPRAMASHDIQAERSEVVDAVERLAFSLVALTTAAMAADGQALEPTFRQWRLLVVLGEVREGHRLGEIAARIGGSAPSASRLVRRLEARGLVTITPDPADGRGIRVALSPVGRTIRSSVIDARRELISHSLRDLQVSPRFSRELDELARALDAFAPVAVVDTLRGSA